MANNDKTVAVSSSNKPRADTDITVTNCFL